MCYTPTIKLDKNENVRYFTFRLGDFNLDKI